MSSLQNGLKASSNSDKFRTINSPWLEQGVDDLQDYKVITKQQILSALMVQHAIHVVLRGNRIFVKHNNDSWLQQQIMESILNGSPHHVFRMFLPLACNGRLPDAEIALTVEDVQRPPIGAKKVPLFCWSKKLGQSCILYPYWQHFHTNSTQEFYGNGMPRWEDKLPIAYFRGATTGRVGF